MPNKKKLTMIVGDELQDLKKVRIPGLDKSFEKLTISELVQLRPGSEMASTWEVNAVTDNVSATTDSSLVELGRIHKVRAMEKVVHQASLNKLRTRISPEIGFSRFGANSADEPSPDTVQLPDSVDDVFSTDSDDDPFKAT